MITNHVSWDIHGSLELNQRHVVESWCETGMVLRCSVSAWMFWSPQLLTVGLNVSLQPPYLCKPNITNK